jgi:hypothetical protein
MEPAHEPELFEAPPSIEPPVRVERPRPTFPRPGIGRTALGAA